MVVNWAIMSFLGDLPAVDVGSLQANIFERQAVTERIWPGNTKTQYICNCSHTNKWYKNLKKQQNEKFNFFYAHFTGRLCGWT